MSKKLKLSKQEMKISIIADDDMVTGFVLAGIGHRDGQGNTNSWSLTARRGGMLLRRNSRS
jgi:hypothetical protein